MNTIALNLYFWISKVLVLYLKSKRIKKKKGIFRLIS